MTREEYEKIENYMLLCMDPKDVAHDNGHIYRVLDHALELKEDYDLDEDVLIASCLLHDIGRKDENRKVNHAKQGGKMAYDFLLLIGWSEEKAKAVKRCIKHHRKKVDDLSIEGQLLFDADKLDVIGSVGIVRNIAHYASHGLAIHYFNESDMTSISNELNIDSDLFIKRFYSDKAKALAQDKLTFHKRFAEELKKEVNSYRNINKRIEDAIKS